MIVGYGTVWRFFEREDITFKKSVRAADQERPDVAAARMRWQHEQPQLDPAKLVFVDESGASTKMARLYGRAKRGRRVVGRVPWGHWKTVTFVAGMRLDGFTAPFVIDCARQIGIVFVMCTLRSFIAVMLTSHCQQNCQQTALKKLALVVEEFA